MSSNQNINLKVEQRISDSTNDRQVVYNSYSSNGGNGSNCNRSVNYFGQPQSQSLENNRDAILIEQLHMSESSTSTNDRKKKQSNSKFATSESDDYYSDDYDDEENEDDDDEENGDSRTVKKSKGSNGSPTNKSRRSETSSAKAKNREHAKNTRQRKKNYIESLKDSVRLLAEERDLVDRERKNQLSRLAEKTAIRKKVLQTFFFYRASAEMESANWKNVVEDDFLLLMPITPYRSFSPSEVVGGQRYIRGVEAVIYDTCSLDTMLQSIGLPLDDGGKITVQYYNGPNECVMSDDTFMCKWHMVTMNAVQRGARYEVAKQGMIKAKFSNSNKLTMVEHIFDVMTFMQQLRRASRGVFDFHVIPNTPMLAQQNSGEARIIIESQPPFRIVSINESWSQLMGYEANEIADSNFSLHLGEQTNREDVEFLSDRIKARLPGVVIMTNYRKDGSRFKNWIRLFPLFNDGAVSYFLAIMEDASRFFAQKPFYFNGQGIPKNIVTSKASSIDNNGSSSSVHTMTENSKSQNNSYTVSSLDDSSSTNSGSSRSGKSRKSQVNLRDSDTKPSTELSGSNDYNNVQYCGNNRDDMSLGITDTSRSYNPDRNVLTTINSAMDDLLAENDPKNERKNCRSENNPQYFDNYGQDGLDDNTSLGDDLLDGVFMEFDRKTSNEAGFYDDN